MMMMTTTAATTRSEGSVVPLDFDHIRPVDVVGLVANKVREGRYLDYKRDLPAGGNEPKKEFLADVTSFANSGGGAIVFGVQEEKDAAGKNTGVPDEIVGLANVNLDAEKLRFEQWLQTGVEPRLPVHRFHILETAPGVTVLVLVVKGSWVGPHMVATADSRFYARTSAGKYALDVTEIRSAFLAGEELPARIRRFRDERLGLIASAETPVELPVGGGVVLHLVPFASVGRRAAVDLQAWAKLSPVSLDGSLIARQFNADGHIGIDGDGRKVRGYVQLLRSGAIEAITVREREVDGLRVLNIWHTEEQIVDGLTRYLNALGQVGVEGPVSVLVSLVGVRGYGLLPSANRGLGGHPVVARDVVTLPDVVVEYRDPDAPAVLRPVFDALWQTFGMARSFCYDESGHWTRDFRW
jgi:hypothetical protein